MTMRANANVSLFDALRLTMAESMAMTIESIRDYGSRHKHWAVAWSGGKDSTTMLTILVHALDAGLVDAPETLTVLYADTRQELPPLYQAALAVMRRLEERGIRVQICTAPMDRRFLVMMLGRGIPPPGARFRWCTGQIKVAPMSIAVDALKAQGDVLLFTGVRQGESAVRDQRIQVACSRNGAECGQGWYQRDLASPYVFTLAPLLHWRVCHVWDWLMFHAPAPEYGGWPVQSLAIAYGGEEAEEINARTGCVGCPVASRDKALETVVRQPFWGHLHPLLQLRPLYESLRQPANRIRKPGLEFHSDGTPWHNVQRMGPLTLDARRMALYRILEIQLACNRDAPPGYEVDILNPEEAARIEELIAAETWPDGWDGDEPRADTPIERVFADGSRQPLLILD